MDKKNPIIMLDKKCERCKLQMKSNFIYYNQQSVVWKMYSE